MVDEEAPISGAWSARGACTAVTGFLSTARSPGLNLSGAGITGEGAMVAGASDIGAPIVDATESCGICVCASAVNSLATAAAFGRAPS